MDFSSNAGTADEQQSQDHVSATAVAHDEPTAFLEPGERSLNDLALAAQSRLGLPALRDGAA